MCMRAHMHCDMYICILSIYMHWHVYTHMHIYTHALTYAYTHVHCDVCMYASCMHTHALWHVYAHSDTCIDMCTMQVHTNPGTHSLTPVGTFSVGLSK